MNSNPGTYVYNTMVRWCKENKAQRRNKGCIETTEAATTKDGPAAWFT